MPTSISYPTTWINTPVTTTGSSLTWSSTSNGTYSVNPSVYVGSGDTKLVVKGDADIDGDIKVKGKSINESLERIEERLAILRPNEELEEKWEKLRGLRQMYMELEQEIIEKEKIWAILKK